jgi:hypothetical protein
MPRTCTVCAHPERHAIDLALVNGQPCRSIASRYVTIGRMALERHKAAHLPVKLVHADAAADLAEACDLLSQVRDLLSQVRDLQTSALRMLQKAEKAGDLRTALGAIREARSNLELLAKLTGELDDRAQINVLLAPEWLHIRAVVLTALEGHPEAKRAVAANLATLEATSA